jgi:hypothetical protein
MEMCNFQPKQENQSLAWILTPRSNTAILQLYLALFPVVWGTSTHKNLLVNNALDTVYTVSAKRLWGVKRNLVLRLQQII